MLKHIRAARHIDDEEHTINDNDAKLNVIMCNTFAKTCDNVQILSACCWMWIWHLIAELGILFKAFSNYGVFPPYNQPIIAIR